MKICAIICEYNPFHNGHLYQLREAKRLSKADAILCLMSGNFVQRGEAAIMNKFTRAKHAIMAGADIVIELPTIFATSNAELFAKGAIHLLTSIPTVTALCFGSENADKKAFISAATALNSEPKEISEKIKNFVSCGMSYAKARAQAWESMIPKEFLNCPNNILGLEYTKALLSKKSNIEILPISRVGAGYNDINLYNNYSSASAIRTAIQNHNSINDQTPDYVLKDLPKKLENQLETLEKYAIIYRASKDISEVCDCNEGLENAFKKAALSNKSLVDTLTSARYTSSRIRRIALQNALLIDRAFIQNSLFSPLYLRILSAKKERHDVFTTLSEADFPVIARAHDKKTLSNTGKECFEKDIFAEKIYSLLYPNDNDKHIFI